MSIQTKSLRLPLSPWVPPAGGLAVEAAGINIHVPGKYAAAIGDQPYQPYMLASQVYGIIGTAGSRLRYDAAGQGWEYRSGAWDGGEAIVYRNVSGTLTEVRRSAITKFRNNKLRARLRGSAGTTSTLIWPVGTASTAIKISTNIALADYRPSATTEYLLIFGVAADGRMSQPIAVSLAIPAAAARGSEVSETTTPIAAGFTVSARTVANLDLSLPAPVSASVSTSGDGNFTINLTRPADETGLIGYAFCTTEDADWDGNWNEAYIDLADDGGAALLPDDMVHIRRVILQPSRDLIFNNVGNVTVADNATPAIWGPGTLAFCDTPPAGVASMQFVPTDETFPGDAPHAAQFVFDGSTTVAIGMGGDIDGAGGYQTDRTYRMQCYARMTSGSLTFSAQRSDHAPHNLPDVVVPLTSAWQLVDLTFSPAVSTDSTVNAGARWRVSGAGTLEICCCRLFDDAIGYRGLSPQEATMLASSGVTTIRHHFSAKPFIWKVTTLDQFLALDAAPDLSTLFGKTTLPMCLKWQAAAGIERPWIILPQHFTLDEHLAVAAYLFEPFNPATDSAATKPWSARRHAHGLSRYTTAVIEYSNETWNVGTFFPWAFVASMGSMPGQRVYGRMANRIFSAMAALPYFPGAGVIRYLGGQAAAIGGSLGEAVNGATDATAIGTADYIGGVDGGEPLRSTSQADYLTATLCGTRTAAARVPAMAALSAAHESTYGAPLKIAVYEGGPGSNSPTTTATADAEADVLKSSAMAVGTFAMLCEYAARGASPFMYFELDLGPYGWTTHNGSPFGTIREAPAWRMTRLFNALMAGKQMQIVTPTSGGAQWQYWTAGGVSIANWPLARVYRADAPGKTIIAAVNMSLPWSTISAGADLWTKNGTNNTALQSASGSLAPVLALASPVAGMTAKLIQFNHAYTANTRLSGTLDVTETALTFPADRSNFTLSGAALGLPDAGLPPCSVAIWVFE